KFEGKKILVPKKESLFYLLFILFSIISTFFSIDREIAFESLLIYISCYFYFIFSFNYQEKLIQYFKWFLIGILIFSCLIFLADRVFHMNLFQEGNSLFYGGYYHNEIGNLLTLGLVISLYDKLPILLLFFLPYFVFSYSRSAYLSLIITSVLLLIKRKTAGFDKQIILLNIILIGILLFFNTTREVNRYFPQPIKNFIEKKLLLSKEKSFTGKRPQHYYYTWLTILEKPFFGVGPGNLYLSTIKKQFNQEEGTTTAHNLVLDVFAENGIFAGIFFMMFLAFIFKKSKKELYFNLFLSLSLIFLFNFSYRYASILLIWIILAGISLTNTKINNNDFNKIMLFSAVVLFVFGQIVLFGTLKIYFLNFKEGYFANLSKAKYHEELDNENMAIFYYKIALYEKPTSSVIILEKIAILNKNIYGQVIGRKQTEKFISQFKKDIKIPKNSDVEKMIKNFCYDYQLTCR
ncbi:MAG: hypothetical protein ACD_12C00102G0002, partial [uncultured bacterium]